MLDTNFGFLLNLLRNPLGAALFAGSLCIFGVRIVLPNSNDHRSRSLQAIAIRGRKVGRRRSFRTDTKATSKRETMRILPECDVISPLPKSRKGSQSGFLQQTKSREGSFTPGSKASPSLRNRFAYSQISGAVVTAIVFLVTSSVALTFPFTCFACVITWQYLKNREIREAKALLQIWPEVTDHLVSGIQAGLSLSEAMVSLSIRGPEIIRPDFLDFKHELLSTGDFANSIENLKSRFRSQGSDQILEAILLAKSLGGSELLGIFRTLGEFLRQDLTLRKEIEIKHGWIKNSAHLSSAAPWLLLLLLSSQPGTVESFSQPNGVLILLLGLVMTMLAYLWMAKLGQLPEPPRVFANSEHPSRKARWRP